MKTFALKTRKGSVVKMMSSKSAKQQKALEQARSKLEDLTRKDVVSFSFILSEEGVELCGEEKLTVDMMNLLEESGMIEVAQRIRMHGQVLHHRSTRQIKIEKLQDAFDTRLPPTLYPLQNMKNYDLLRSLLNDVMKVEGLGRPWRPGDNPPESVQQMVKRKPFYWGRRREVFLSWIIEKNSKRIVLYRKEIYMVLLSSLRLANNLEGSTSLFEAGKGSVEAIFIEGRLGGQ